MRRAVCSNNLKERSNINSVYGTNDFDTWVNDLIDGIEFNSVLDICCGTGNQLVKYAVKNEKAKIVGVDLSRESLQVADKRLQAQGTAGFKLNAISMEDMFAGADLIMSKFDLISCFYGLYYSQDVNKTIQQMIAHLTNRGSILIVGPYGKNNATLFEILQRHFRLPELVIRSATTFMEHEVYSLLKEATEVTVNSFVNPIRFPDADSIINYWRASTFYSGNHEDLVRKDVEQHFEKHGEFVMEKHVLAYLARKI